MTLHDALKGLATNEESIEKIENALKFKPDMINTQSMAESELRQNVEILELRVQESAKAERQTAGETATMSPEREKLRGELHQARQDLSIARTNPKQAEALFSDLSARRSADGETITAAGRAEKNPYTGTLEELPVRYEQSTKNALKRAGEYAALGAGIIGLGTVVAGMAAAPGTGLLMNGVFLTDRDAFPIAGVGVAANLVGTVGFLTGDPSLAVPGMIVSAACALGAGAIHHRYR